MWTGVMSRSYYSLTLRGASERWNSHEYFLKLMAAPALIFTKCAVIYNGKDHRGIHQRLPAVPLVDQPWPAFSILDSSKGKPGPALEWRIKTT